MHIWPVAQQLSLKCLFPYASRETLTDHSSRRRHGRDGGGMLLHLIVSFVISSLQMPNNNKGTDRALLPHWTALRPPPESPLPLPWHCSSHSRPSVLDNGTISSLKDERFCPISRYFTLCIRSRSSSSNRSPSHCTPLGIAITYSEPGLGTGGSANITHASMRNALGRV